jgi:hypothetical protein
MGKQAEKLLWYSPQPSLFPHKAVMRPNSERNPFLMTPVWFPFHA